MKRNLRLAACVLAAGAGVAAAWAGAAEPQPAVAPAAGGQTGNLRVLGVYSNCFEYLFMSVAGVAGGQPCLAFNHLDGRTSFVKVGDRLGAYTVRKYEPRDTQRFNPSLNAMQTEKSGVATLAGADGESFPLEMGKIRAQPGFLAMIGDLKTGAAFYARAGDAIGTGAAQAVVSEVAPEQVTVTADQGTRMIGPPSQEEHAALLGLWRSRLEREKQPEKPAIAQSAESAATAAVALAGVAAQVGQPSHIVQLTFNPLQVVEALPWEQTAAYVVSSSPTATGTGFGVSPVRLSIPMPRFRVTSYTGTVSVYAR
jgi:hypothetical protein